MSTVSSTHILATPIEFLKGVGPKKADLLKTELNIFVYRDLLEHYPFRYIDKSQFHRISDIESEETAVQIKGKFKSIKEVGLGKQKRLNAIFEDDSGEIQLVWFKGVQWVKQGLNYDDDYVIYGKPKRFGRSFSISHPDVTKLSDAKLKLTPFKPVYHSTEKCSRMGLHSQGIENLMISLIQQVRHQVKETLPSELLEKYKLPSKEEAVFQVHRPKGLGALQRSLTRLKLEELLFLQLILVNNKAKVTTKMKGVTFPEVGALFTDFYKDGIPFDLTGAQKRVLKEVRKDVKHGAHMNRLIQGDVGSGKTIVAVLTALLGIDNGFQVCLMAPTEILATQHFEGISELLKDFPVNVELLTGSSTKAKRKIIHEDLLNGELHFLIGTHALLEPVVKFKNLGLAIIDEQHRFGVKQRARLWKKAAITPHVLVMTATPIPRTLAMTLYGDLDVSTIDELPPGRKLVKTTHKKDKDRIQIFGFLESEIKKGRQVYVVYPLIEESESEQLSQLKDLYDGHEALERRFPRPEYQISIVHGRQRAADKEYEMNRFVKKETQILVATTVIEVGVNVPNASVMVIENAERFGLSQLHQLRGRVGRGAEQSHCILMTGTLKSPESKKRIQTMCSTNDGFEIAQVDLELRGPGDMMGTQQSGTLDLNIADLALDQKILAKARELALEYIEDDPELTKPKHASMNAELKRIRAHKPNWGNIS
ncbi:MAG: ATP-dependent DNA helicase RecG [Flavobacteriales bacterium]